MSKDIDVTLEYKAMFEINSCSDNDQRVTRGITRGSCLLTGEEVRSNCGRGCSIAECVGAQEDFLALGNSEGEIEEEILDEQYLDQHFSIIGATNNCRSDLSKDVSLKGNNEISPDPLRVCRKIVSYYVPRKGSMPLYGCYEPFVKQITKSYYTKMVTND